MSSSADKEVQQTDDVVRLARAAFVSDTSYAIAIVTAASEPGRDK